MGTIANTQVITDAFELTDSIKSAYDTGLSSTEDASLSLLLDAEATAAIDTADSSNDLNTAISLYDSDETLLAFNEDGNNSALSDAEGEIGEDLVAISADTLADPFSATGQGTGRTYDLEALKGIDFPFPRSEFNIEIVFRGNGLSNSQKAIFEQAANRWEEIIVGDLPDVRLPRNPLLGPFSGLGVDDLIIAASAPSIDGQGSVLGQAGPVGLRPDSRLPFAGIMQFDSADLDVLEREGQLDDVILHEMGHVLGIGTIWEELGLLEGAGTNTVRYTGERATAEFNDIFGVNRNAIPVENTGGPGTADGHWRESIFDNELMTGFLNPGENPLSRITIASLADLGYEVNLRAADPYTPPTPGSTSRSSESFGEILAMKPTDFDQVLVNIDGTLTFVPVFS